MQKTTMIYRNANYQSRAKCAKSLSHSLRIKTNDFKKNEWVEELQDHAWIFSPTQPNGMLLNSIPEDKKNEFLNEILDGEFGAKSVSPKVKSDFSKYQYKLDKKIETVAQMDLPYLEEQLRYIKKHKPDDYRERIDAIEGVKRKNQLLGMLDKYMALAHKVDGTTNQAESKIHEAFFKFPHQHGVTPDPKRMADCMRSFYETNAPDYDIGLLVVHDDERGKDQTTGAHPHLFMSTQNSKTGKRDLSLQLRRQANKWLEANPTQVQVWDETNEMHVSKTVSNIDLNDKSYATTKLQGIILQDMFMAHVREAFPELDVVWTKSRERKVKAFHSQYEDAKKPKADRTYNLDNMLHEQVEQNQQLIQEQRSELDAVVRQKQDAEYDTLQAEGKLQRVEGQLAERIGNVMRPYIELIEGIKRGDPEEDLKALSEKCIKLYRIAPKEVQKPVTAMVLQAQKEAGFDFSEVDAHADVIDAVTPLSKDEKERIKRDAPKSGKPKY